jgi:hypothetical protein
VPVHEQGTAKVDLTNTNIAVHNQQTTEVVISDTLTPNSSLENVDVTDYKEIRISTGNRTCLGGDEIQVFAVEGVVGGAVEYSLDRIPFCDEGASRTYEVAGRKLDLYCSPCAADDHVDVVVFGRRN